MTSVVPFFVSLADGHKNGPISGRGAVATPFGQKMRPFSGRECSKRPSVSEG